MTTAAVLQELKPFAGKFKVYPNGVIRTKYQYAGPRTGKRAALCPLALLLRQRGIKTGLTAVKTFEKQFGLSEADVWDLIWAADWPGAKLQNWYPDAEAEEVKDLRAKILKALALTEPE